MPKIVNKEKMIQSIMKAALLAFVKHGFYKTTMDKIAKEAGIAKGTLYLYFDSKEMLSQSIMYAHFEKFNSNLMSQNYFSTLESFLNHIETGLLLSKQELLFIPIFFEAFGPSFASKEFALEIAVFFDKIGDYYAHHLQLLIDQGEIDNQVDAIVLGRVLTSMLDGILLHKSLFEVSDIRYKKMVSEATNLFRRGLARQ